MRGEDHRGALRHLVQLLDEHRAERAQPIDDVPVVHDFVPHVDRRAEQLERALDDVDGAIDAGAEAARIGEQHLHRSRATACAFARRLSSNASSSSRHRADGDRGIRDVEGREVRVVPVDVDEVDDVPEPHAVDHVAERAAEISDSAQASSHCERAFSLPQPDDDRTR